MQHQISKHKLKLFDKFLYLPRISYYAFPFEVFNLVTIGLNK